MSQYPNTERGIRHPGPGTGSGTYGENPASGPAPTTAGHHKHDLLNKLDPRVDSTHDRAPAQAMMQGSSNNNNIPAGTYGPHSSRIANALDPRVDSDMDGRGQRHNNNMNMAGGGAGAGVGAGTAAYGGGAAGAPEGTYGPHSSRLANAMDPRVDSDRDGRAQAGYQGTGYPHDGTTGVGGYGQPQQQAGYGGSAMSGANAMTGTGAGPGPAAKTAGPHKSDLMNKLDPRVDSKTGMMKEAGYSERRGI